jgi:UDP-glucose 4-epimerase
VRVVDDLSTGNLRRLDDVRSTIDVVQADLATADLAPILDGVDRIFHLAAIPSVPRSVADPARTHAAVATATVRLLDAAKRSGARRFVYSSSSSVYGDAAETPKHEGLPTQPVSPYGVAKLAGESYVRVFAQLHGMRAVTLRYFNVFGPGQDPASEYAAVIPRFIVRGLGGDEVTIFGDGGQTRDFTYVDNVVDANIRAAEADVVPGRVFNIAGGEPHSVLELVSELQTIIGRPIRVRHAEPRQGDIRDSHADIGAAIRDLGWKPKVAFAEGLSRTVASFRG